MDTYSFENSPEKSKEFPSECQRLMIGRAVEDHFRKSSYFREVKVAFIGIALLAVLGFLGGEIGYGIKILGLVSFRAVKSEGWIALAYRDCLCDDSI